jgi:hypothetical protein
LAFLILNRDAGQSWSVESAEEEEEEEETFRELYLVKAVPSFSSIS